MRAVLIALIGVMAVFLGTTSTPTVPAQALPTLKGHKNTITCLAFSKDGTLLVSGAKDGTAIVWDVKAKRELFSFSGHKDMVTSVALSPGAKVLATSGHDSAIR